MQEKEYIRILIDSLKKKLVILNKIQVICKDQNELLADPNLGPDEFDSNVDDKEQLIDELVRLDGGFDEVFSHVEKEISSNRENYSSEIREMQDLIKEIESKDTLIRALEAKNHDMALAKFSRVKKQVKEVRSSQRMVNSYYQNMMRVQGGMDPRFLDNKK